MRLAYRRGLVCGRCRTGRASRITAGGRQHRGPLPDQQAKVKQERLKTLMARIALYGAIVIVVLLVLAAQRYIANKRLANNRRNRDEQAG